jgi:hypothetical protein
MHNGRGKKAKCAKYDGCQEWKWRGHSKALESIDNERSEIPGQAEDPRQQGEPARGRPRAQDHPQQHAVEQRARDEADEAD